MGLGMKIPVTLAAEQLVMKGAISDALIAFWNSMETASATSTPTTKKEYADEFARVLSESMFPRILDYVIANANITALGGVIPPAPVNPTTITVTPVITLL